MVLWPQLDRLPLATSVAGSVNTLNSAVVLLNMHLAMTGVILQSVKGLRGMVVVISAILTSQHIV